MKEKGKKVRKFLKFVVVAICLTGFLFQTHEFLELYWTYPTVVDIQVSVPSEIELPAISFCSTNGIKPSVICEQKDFCIDSKTVEKEQVCNAFPDLCFLNKDLDDKNFQIVSYNKYSTHSNFNASVMQLLRKPLKGFFYCKIKSAGQSRDCDLSNIKEGSYFSDTNLFNFCYIMNGKWFNPNYVSPTIKKSERMEMEFVIDISDANASEDHDAFPHYNYPSYPGVQLAVHSPHVSLSPYVIGSGFLAGKAYQIKLEQQEKHLLPAPYQTNCTDYVKQWKARGGVGPLNQMMVVEECVYNVSLEKYGCIPFSIDYPHQDTVCRYSENNNDLNIIRHECSKQLEDYNQPCDFVSYEMHIEEKLVDIEKKLDSYVLGIHEAIVQKRKGFDCSNEKIWQPVCQKVTIELVFDNFQITNLTYNPKFESLELFSVIGGYMGMYLGVSIVAFYDFLEIILIAAYQFTKKKQVQKTKGKPRKVKVSKKSKENYNRFSGYYDTNVQVMY